jgi:hypothetical protein
VRPLHRVQGLLAVVDESAMSVTIAPQQGDSIKLIVDGATRIVVNGMASDLAGLAAVVGGRAIAVYESWANGAHARGIVAMGEMPVVRDAAP